MVQTKTLSEMFTDLTNAKFRADEIAAKKKYDEETKNYREAFNFVKNVITDIVGGKFEDVTIERDSSGNPLIKTSLFPKNEYYDILTQSLKYIDEGIEEDYDFKTYVNSKNFRYYKSKNGIEERIHSICMEIDGLMVIINKSNKETEISMSICKYGSNKNVLTTTHMPFSYMEKENKEYENSDKAFYNALSELDNVILSFFE